MKHNKKKYIQPRRTTNQIEYQQMKILFGYVFNESISLVFWTETQLKCNSGSGMKQLS